MPRKLFKSFSFALAGVRYMLLTQRNMRIHLYVGVGVIVAGILLRLTNFEMALVIFAMFLVFTVEMLNTSIEEAINLLYKKHALHAKLAKDISAAATLFAGICAIIVGCLVLIPRLITLVGMVAY